MRQKVIRTELDQNEYQAFARLAGKKGLTIVEALRLAVQLWVQEESGINPRDPIFDIALGRRKAQDWGKGTEGTSREVDDILYGK